METRAESDLWAVHLASLRAGDRVLARDVRLQARRGELIALVGPTGAGKTTLLHTLAGLLPGAPPAPGRRVFVPQERRLVPRWTASENVAVTATRDVGDRLGLADMWEQPAGDLSAGQAARLQLLRAFAADPDVLLVDEPTGNLDPEAAVAVVDRLKEEARGRFVVVATHDPLVLEAAHRIWEIAGQVVERRVLEPSSEPRTLALARDPGALSLAWALARGRRGAALGALAAAAATLALVGTLVGFARGGTDFLTEGVLGRLPTGMVRVVAPRLGLGPVEFEIGDRLGDEALGKLAALPGVEAAHPQRFADFPVSLRISFLGRSLHTDAALEGLTADWLEDDIRPEDFTWRPGEPIPAVVSEQLVSMFNAGFASSQGLPRIKSSVLRRLDVRATLGRSSFGRMPGAAEELDVRILGVSRRVSAVALGVPTSVVDHYGGLFARRRGKEAPDQWTSVVLELGSAEDAGVLEELVDGLGLRLEDDAGPAAMLARAMTLLRSAGSAAGAAATALSAILLGLLLRSRHALMAPDGDVLELAGVQSTTVRRAALWDAALISGLGAVVGVFLARASGALLEEILVAEIRDATGLRPESLFAADASDLALAALLPVVALLSTAPAVWRRTRIPLLERLRRGIR